jgi:uncharacterized protein DUF6812
MAILMAILGWIACGHSLARLSDFKFSRLRAENLMQRPMDELFGSQVDDPSESRERRRVERAVFETDRQLVEGDLTLPPAGYQSRFSDSLNRGEFEFVPLTNARVTSLADGAETQVPFLVLSKRQIRIAYPIEQ